MRASPVPIAFPPVPRPSHAVPIPFAAVADAQASVPEPSTRASAPFTPSRSFLQSFQLRTGAFRGDSDGRRDDCAARTVVPPP